MTKDQINRYAWELRLIPQGQEVSIDMARVLKFQLECANRVLKEETGWLVENGKPNTEYRYLDETGIYWTADVNKAIRFARREDAEMFAAGDEEAWRIVEHMWCKS